MNTGGHPFWWALSMICVVWYSTITIYVAIKGAKDVKDMLKNIGKHGSEKS